MKENRKLLKEVLRDIQKDMTDEEVLSLLADSRVSVNPAEEKAKYTLGQEVRITRDRGRWFNQKGTWMLPTYHPSALLRDPAKKREAWEDMQTLRDKLIELGLYTDIYGGAE